MRKHRFRQTPQRSSHFPIRSMKIIRLSSLLSTFVTRWAFKRSCFLINVSMSTSVLFLSLVCMETTTKGYKTRGALPLGLKAFNSNYTFRIGTVNQRRRRASVAEDVAYYLDVRPGIDLSG